MAALQPGGDHVMFMGLNAPLKEGDTFPLTLVFKNAGEVTINVTVKAAGAMGAGSMKMPMKH
ncbi:MAG: copper chaperone PCu(A)C, partial [Rhodospirillales bacterium]|nr:copper chaperone PCu(A)C [Rhodospirillales bacterium]